MLIYPAAFKRDAGSGGYVVTFPDIPEGVTQGDNLEEAQSMARDCILSVFAYYVRHGIRIPSPSRLRAKSQRPVPLPFVASLKVELYNAWLESGLKKSELARRLSIPKTVVDRLFSLRHNTRPDLMESAFRVLGKEIDLQIRPAA